MNPLRVLRPSPYDRQILHLAVPAFGALVAEPVYILTDTAIVGHLGTEQLAGLAVASAILLTAYALLVFLAYATTGTVARLVGAGAERDAAHEGLQGLWLGTGLGTVIGIFFVAAAEPLVELFGASGAVTGYAVTYLRISALGVPAVLITLAGTGYLRGVQDTRTPLLVAVGTAVGNLVVELALVYGAGLGIAGSAWSTVLAQTAGAAVYVVLVTGAARRLGTVLGPEPRALLRYARSGFALAVRTAALRGAFVVAALVAARMGTADLAAYQIGYEVWALLALSLDAIAIAGQALTGRYLGASDPVTARRAADRMIELSALFGVVVGVVLLMVRPWLGPVFSDDPEVTALATFVLAHVALMQPLNGVVFAIDGILIGAGDLRWLAGAMAVAAAAFAVAATAVLASGAGLGWLLGALWLLMAARAAALLYRFGQDRWLVVGAPVRSSSPSSSPRRSTVARSMASRARSTFVRNDPALFDESQELAGALSQLTGTASAIVARRSGVVRCATQNSVEVTTTVRIDAPPAEVWAVLIDIDRWPTWTTSMQQVRRLDEGDLRVGSRAEVKQPGFPKVVWTVTSLEPGRSFTWEASNPGVRSAGDHVIEPSGDGSVVTLRIRQNGPLAGLLRLLFGRRTRRYVEMEADGLRTRAESAQGS